MAILTQRKDYKPGDAVPAAVINDTIDTAITAYEKTAQAAVSAAAAQAAAQQIAATGGTIVKDDSGTAIPAIEKSELLIFDKVIRTQQEFNVLISSPNWKGAVCVAFAGQFVYGESVSGGIQSTTGIKIPDTVKRIQGFSGAKITVTNFIYNATTAKGGLWYDALLTTGEYSISDLSLNCVGVDTSNPAYGFVNCTYLTRCTGDVTGQNGQNGGAYCFESCAHLTDCTGAGMLVGGGMASCRAFNNCTDLKGCSGSAYVASSGGCGVSGFFFCSQLVNCTGAAKHDTGHGMVRGFGFCDQLTNCTGTGMGTGAGGCYGFYNCSWVNGCKGSGVSGFTGGVMQYVDNATVVAG